MIVCPLCFEDSDAVELYCVHTVTGTRLVVDCPHCGKTYPVELLPDCGNSAPLELG